MPDAKFQPLTITPIQFSLTEGTSIPPPEESPPESVRPPTPGRGPLDSHPTTPKKVNGEAPSTPTEEKHDKVEPAQQQTLAQNGVSSPTGHKRLGTVRKFFSIRRGNTSRIDVPHHSNGPAANTKQSTDSILSSRPGSPLTANTVTSGGTATSPRSLPRKKSSGWFNSSKRKSGMYMVGRLDEGVPPEEGHKPLVPRGPPPPAIPEFAEFNSLDGALDESLGGSDIFKDIK